MVFSATDSQHERFKSGLSGSVQNSDQVSAQERDVTGSDRIQEDVLTEGGGSRNTMQVASADQFQAPDGKNESVQDSKFDMSDKQLEYVRKLQVGHRLLSTFSLYVIINDEYECQ